MRLTLRAIVPLVVIAVAALALPTACNNGSDPIRAARIEAAPGTLAQVAIAGSAVPLPPSVVVTDSKGAGLGNVTVVFSVTAGGGSVIPASIVTDANGMASAAGWILGPSLGTNRLTATVSGLPPVTFTADGIAGIPVSVTPVAGTTPQSAVVASDVPVAPAVVIRDQAGNPNAGIVVTFSASSGVVSPTSVTTDANGRATTTRWTLGTQAGTQVLTARAGVLPVAQFVATALPGPAAAVAVLPASLTLLSSEARQIAAAVTDVYGNAVSSGTLQFSSSNTSVATVTAVGLVSAVSPGTASITISSGTISRSVPVFVISRIGGLSGRPFGVRVLSGSIAYVTRQDANLATRVDVSTMQSGVSAPTGADPSEIVFDASGTLGYTPNVLGGSVSIVRLSSHTLEQLVAVSGSPFRAVMSPDGQRVYISQNNGAVAVLETGSRTISATFLLSGPLNGVAITADGGTLFVTSMGGAIYRLNALTGQVLASRSYGGVAQEVVISPNGSSAPTEIYVANEAGWIDVLDATTLDQKRRVTALGAFGMTMSPDGTRLFVSASQAGNVYAFRRSDMSLLATYNVGGMPRRISFTADGRALVANEGNWVDVLP